MKPSGRPGQWPYGRLEVEALLDRGHLRLCEPDEPRALRLIAKARQHHESAGDLAGKPDPDVETALDALHSGNRKACEGVLLAQGIESTKEGGHLAAVRVVREQTRIAGRSRPELAVYEVVRQLRHDGDYGNQLHELPASDVLDNLPDCRVLVDVCSGLIGRMGIFVDGR